MKTNRKHGFTIVELVVVIAIIAVLAAVLIPTFASIIKKANDSAYLQERQSKQIEDLAEKVEKINYFTWEDFEKKLAEELAKMPSTSEEYIKAAVTAAMQQYQGEHAGQNTGLTEDQVTKIVNEAMKGQLTTAQVEAIVNQAVAGVGGGLTTEQVQAIVKQALAGMGQTGLNASQVKAQIAAVLANSNLANKESVEAAIAQALAKIENLTAEEVQAIVSKAVSDAIAESKSASTVYIAGDMELDDDITYILRTMNTLDSVVLTAPSGKTVTKVIIDAPNVKNVEIVGAGKVTAIEIQKTAESSTHVRVEVGTLVINSGRVVLESGAKVTGTLTAAPSINANVIVELETGATVTHPIVAEYQDHGTGTGDTITVIDNTATVGGVDVQLVASNELALSGTTTTNVQLQGENLSTDNVENKVATTNEVEVVEVKINDTTYVKTEDASYVVTHHEAKAASCTEVGYDAYDSYEVNGEVVKIGYKEVPATGHTKAENPVYAHNFNGQWQHATQCSVCSQWIVEYCADEDDNNACDACGHQMYIEVRSAADLYTDRGFGISNGYYKLMNDVALTKPQYGNVYLNSNVVIDLNGYTLSNYPLNSPADAQFRSYGTANSTFVFTLKDSSEAKTGQFMSRFGDHFLYGGQNNGNNKLIIICEDGVTINTSYDYQGNVMNSFPDGGGYFVHGVSKDIEIRNAHLIIGNVAQVNSGYTVTFKNCVIETRVSNDYSLHSGSGSVVYDACTITTKGGSASALDSSSPSVTFTNGTTVNGVAK